MYQIRQQLGKMVVWTFRIVQFQKFGSPIGCILVHPMMHPWPGVLNQNSFNFTEIFSINDKFESGLNQLSGIQYLLESIKSKNMVVVFATLTFLIKNT